MGFKAYRVEMLTEGESAGQWALLGVGSAGTELLLTAVTKDELRVKSGDIYGSVVDPAFESVQPIAAKRIGVFWCGASGYDAVVIADQAKISIGLVPHDSVEALTDDVVAQRAVALYLKGQLLTSDIVAGDIVGMAGSGGERIRTRASTGIGKTESPRSSDALIGERRGATTLAIDGDLLNALLTMPTPDAIANRQSISRLRLSPLEDPKMHLYNYWSGGSDLDGVRCVDKYTGDKLRQKVLAMKPGWWRGPTGDQPQYTPNPISETTKDMVALEPVNASGVELHSEMAKWFRDRIARNAVCGAMGSSSGLYEPFIRSKTDEETDKRQVRDALIDYTHISASTLSDDDIWEPLHQYNERLRMCLGKARTPESLEGKEVFAVTTPADREFFAAWNGSPKPLGKPNADHDDEDD